MMLLVACVEQQPNDLVKIPLPEGLRSLLLDPVHMPNSTFFLGVIYRHFYGVIYAIIVSH